MCVLLCATRFVSWCLSWPRELLQTRLFCSHLIAQVVNTQHSFLCKQTQFKYLWSTPHLPHHDQYGAVPKWKTSSPSVRDAWETPSAQGAQSTLASSSLFPKLLVHYTFPQATSALYFSPSNHQLGATKPIMHNSFPHQATTQPLSAIYRSLVLFAHYCCVLLFELAHYFLSVALRCPDASLIVLRLAQIALNALCNHDPFSQNNPLPLFVQLVTSYKLMLFSITSCGRWSWRKKEEGEAFP